jgi:hypothetical protein
VRPAAPLLACGFDQPERIELLAEIPLVDAFSGDGLAGLLQFRERETPGHQLPRDAFRVEPVAQALGRMLQDPGVVEREFGQFVEGEQPRVCRIASRLQCDAVGGRKGDVDDRDDALARIAIGTAECTQLLQVTGLEPGLLAKLPPRRALEAFVDADETAGERPFAGMRPVPAPDQYHGEASGDDRDYGDVHGDRGMRMFVGIGHRVILVSQIHEY